MTSNDPIMNICHGSSLFVREPFAREPFVRNVCVQFVRKTIIVRVKFDRVPICLGPKNSMTFFFIIYNF